MASHRSILGGLALAAVLAGCERPERGAQDAPAAPSASAARAPLELPAGAQQGWSNARGFYAAWRPLPSAVPLNEEFTAEVWLFEDESRTRPIESAEVEIDCRMPAHQHGMLRDVELVPAGEGRYVAEGLLCHMLGHWELSIDLTRGPLVERAQFDVDLE